MMIHPVKFVWSLLDKSDGTLATWNPRFNVTARDFGMSWTSLMVLSRSNSGSTPQRLDDPHDASESRQQDFGRFVGSSNIDS
ncbi:MAG: hypothetical protein KDJ54_13695 [Candidatus Competibacteraceae bacterium]|nr:hypothetical protein [Candidatus Competibacteraceae bacterium]